MRYIKTYMLYNEELDFDIKTSDPVDLKTSKESLMSIKNNLEDFKSKKIKVDDIFKRIKDNNQLKLEVDNLLGKDKLKRNPFLVSYIQVAQDNKRLDKLISDISSDKISIEQNRALMSASSDDVQKKNLQDTINNIQKRIDDSNKSISILKRDIDLNKKKIDDDMRKTEEDIKNKIKTIEVSRK